MAGTPASSRSSSGAAFVGAIIRKTGTIFGYDQSGPLAFATALFDSDGYFDAPNNKLVIPAGMAGWYVVGSAITVGGNLVSQTDFEGNIATSGTPNGLFVPMVAYTGFAAGSTSAVMDAVLDVGDDLVCYLNWNGGGSVNVSDPTLFVQYLGPDS